MKGFRIPIFLKGLGMGAADVVPGVSGGTIAFITGIYEELISTIKHLNFDKLKVLKNDGVLAFWHAINGTFLLSLITGILISFLSLARVITYLLTHHPILLFSFFFGLILASAVYIGKQIQQWDWKHILTLLAGIIIAYFITLITPAQGADVSFLTLFFAGAIAICAMILPGISGAFILLLLGQYNTIIEAVKTFDFSVILPVGLGAVVGLLSFSRILNWLFNHFRTITLAGLTGFVLGALNKVWPWKEVVETYVDRHGDIQPLIERSISPFQYAELTDQPALFGSSILVALVGFALVFGLEKIAAQ